MLIRRLILSVIMVCVSTGTALGISPKKVIENVENALTSSGTVRLDFQETYIWKLTGEEQSLQGELLLTDKDRFRVTTEDQIIVSDGRVLWTYSKPSHRVLIDNLSSSENAILPRQILFQYTQDYQSRVVGESLCNGKTCLELLFTSDTGDTFIPRIRVWVDSKAWIPVRVEQTDLNENQTVYLLENVQIDTPIDEEMFRFTIPDDAEVIDMR